MSEKQISKPKDLGAASTGFDDWYWQRISAVVVLVLLTSLFAILLLTYAGRIHIHTLNLLFTHPIGKILTTILVLSLGLHIWVGLKVIFEDYIHFSAGRLVILNIILIGLIAVGLYFMYNIWAEVAYHFSCIPCGTGAK
ncbi:MAG: succinate dehydrogenase, hydrophobic membrane anchor protein [Zetaproteobacteria bacterium CG2_30_46_52]|nr:MAG: succinate dehydrogenase, hydrophobic membrane anchor protein [Zetaproteobacteria bacterium CG2_30_46_52]